MTVYELSVAFKEEMDKTASASAPVFSQGQVDFYLNLGAERFVKQRFGGNNPHRTGFEVSQKRTDDLRTLVTYAQLAEIGPGFISNKTVRSTAYALPSDYWFSVLEFAVFSRYPCPRPFTKDCDGNVTFSEGKELAEIGIKQRRHGEVSELVLDPYNRPEGLECFRVIVGQTIELYVDRREEVSGLKLGYIRQYSKLKEGFTYTKGLVNNWKELEYWMPLHTHIEIVELGVKAAIESTENPRYATYPNELSTQE